MTYQQAAGRLLSACLVLGTIIASHAAQGAPIKTGCVPGSDAAAERLVDDCSALLGDTTTAEEKLPSLFLARAEAYTRQGRWRLAIDDLGNVVQRRPDHAAAFFRRGELYRALGDADAAIRDFSSAIRLEPKDVAALLARAELYRAKADRRRALADFSAVLRIDSNHGPALEHRRALVLEIERLGAMMPVQ